MQIPLETVGHILNSDKALHRVKVSDDATNTGGFLIYQWWQGSNGPNQDFAFDDWVENEQALHHFFREAGWQVRWAA